MRLAAIHSVVNLMAAGVVPPSRPLLSRHQLGEDAVHRLVPLVGDGDSVGMGLLFYPRGGSARVAGYLSRALAAYGWRVTLACGSLGGSGASGNAVTVFSGVDIVPAAYDDAVARWGRGEDPMDAPFSMHPSFEARAGVPDRGFPWVSPTQGERITAAWASLIARSEGMSRARLLHLHHLTPIHDAVALALPGVPVVPCRCDTTGTPGRASATASWIGVRWCRCNSRARDMPSDRATRLAHAVVIRTPCVGDPREAAIGHAGSRLKRRVHRKRRIHRILTPRPPCHRIVIGGRHDVHSRKHRHSVSRRPAPAQRPTRKRHTPPIRRQRTRQIPSHPRRAATRIDNSPIPTESPSPTKGTSLCTASSPSWCREEAAAMVVPPPRPSD